MSYITLSQVTKFLLQMTVEAYDGGVPPLTADIFVVVNVIKNRFSPEFRGQPYRFELSENTLPGSIIYRGEYRSSPYLQIDEL